VVESHRSVVLNVSVGVLLQLFQMRLDFHGPNLLRDQVLLLLEDAREGEAHVGHGVLRRCFEDGDDLLHDLVLL